MNKLDITLWYLPLCFFVFVTIFMFVKFIFIFFFSAAFEPSFMFDLTPYYLLSGVNNLHLLLLSLIVIGFDAYLHFKISKKNLTLSFIPTSIMLTGLGFKITVSDMTTYNFSNYLIFGFLLIILLIDQRHILTFPEIAILSERRVDKFGRYRPAIAKSRRGIAAQYPILQARAGGKPSGFVTTEEILKIQKETLSEIKSLIKDDIRMVHERMEELERRTRKVNILEEEIRNKRYRSPAQDNIPHKEELVVDVKKLTPKDYPTVDKFAECAVILKRGVLKQANLPFVKLLGFEKEIILEKNLLNFIAPEGLFNVEKYYIDRLKGDGPTSFETILLTNDDIKIHVEITIKPTIYNGEAADIAIIRQI